MNTLLTVLLLTAASASDAPDSGSRVRRSAIAANCWWTISSWTDFPARLGCNSIRPCRRKSCSRPTPPGKEMPVATRACFRTASCTACTTTPGTIGTEASRTKPGPSTPGSSVTWKATMASIGGGRNWACSSSTARRRTTSSSRPRAWPRLAAIRPIRRSSRTPIPTARRTRATSASSSASRMGCTCSSRPTASASASPATSP